MNKNGSDDFQTPPQALNPLIPYLDPYFAIWECAKGKGYIQDRLMDLGFDTFGTDIKDGKDFLTYTPDREYDCIITNPPFSLKNEFIERCYELGKPFALLLPLAALETQRRQKQWKKGLQLILINKRINFETPNNKDKSGSWFATAWFTHGLDLPKDIIFGNI